MSLSQEIFDKVKNHLLTQMKRSMDLDIETRTDICRYRGPNGLKCAIGCLINDEDYSADMEGQLFYDHRIAEALIKSVGEDIKNLPIRFLGRLQKLHDHIPVEKWEEHLHRFAEKYNLNWN